VHEALHGAGAVHEHEHPGHDAEPHEHSH
jgi:hypothetical protein